MKKNIIIIPLLFLFLLTGCTQNPIIAEMFGNIGRDAEAIYADIAFDLFTYGSSGEGDGTRLSLTFDNYSGEYITFTLSPYNPSGATFEEKYSETTYNIDGSTNQFEGLLIVGTGTQSFKGSTGWVALSNFGVSEDGGIVVCAGTFKITIDGGGRVEGNFNYQASSSN